MPMCTAPMMRWMMKTTEHGGGAGCSGGVSDESLVRRHAAIRGDCIYARNKEALDVSRASAAAAPGTIPLHRGGSHRVTRSHASVTAGDELGSEPSDDGQRKPR